MASTPSPKAKRTPSSRSDLLTPAEIEALRQDLRDSLPRIRKLLKEADRAERRPASPPDPTADRKS